MLGSAWQLTEDCWNKNYVGAPTDGSAWKTGQHCEEVHTKRGGGFSSLPLLLRPANRIFEPSSERWDLISFRVARALH